MLKVGILSDTHCTLIPQLFDFFKDVDELWHAGDIGNIETADALAQLWQHCGASSPNQSLRKPSSEVSIRCCAPVIAHTLLQTKSLMSA